MSGKAKSMAKQLEFFELFKPSEYLLNSLLYLYWSTIRLLLFYQDATVRRNISN